MLQWHFHQAGRADTFHVAATGPGVASQAPRKVPLRFWRVGCRLTPPRKTRIASATGVLLLVLAPSVQPEAIMEAVQMVIGMR